MADEQFCLRWNDHKSTVFSVFDKLLENGNLVDCTLAAEGEYLNAHRVVLCASSPYLEALLCQHYEKHPIVILNDVKSSELKYIIDYMYRGEVNIPQDHIQSFFKAAEALRIKGLSEHFTNKDAVQPVIVTNSTGSVRHSVVASESPECSSRAFSLPKRRRKNTRKYRGDNIFVEDAHLDTGNSYDSSSREQSTLIAPDISENNTSITSPSSNRNINVKSEQTETVNRTNVYSSPLKSKPIKEHAEPCRSLLEPKTEYLNDDNSEYTVVEDLTLDDDDDDDNDDDEIDRSYISDISKPHQSYGIGFSSTSNQRFPPWQIGTNQLAFGGVFTSTRGGQSAHRGLRSRSSDGNVFKCESCGKTYQHKGNLNRHQRYECGDQRPFVCSHCPFAAKQKNSLQLHVYHHHM